MSDDDPIAELKRQIEELRSAAQQSDANLAFLVGLIAGLSEQPLKFDAESMLKSVNIPGWSSVVIERFSAGREVIENARRSAH